MNNKRTTQINTKKLSLAVPSTTREARSQISALLRKNAVVMKALG